MRRELFQDQKKIPWLMVPQADKVVQQVFPVALLGDRERRLQLIQVCMAPVPARLQMCWASTRTH